MKTKRLSCLLVAAMLVLSLFMVAACNKNDEPEHQPVYHRNGERTFARYAALRPRNPHRHRLCGRRGDFRRGGVDFFEHRRGHRAGRHRFRRRRGRGAHHRLRARRFGQLHRRRDRRRRGPRPENGRFGSIAVAGRRFRARVCVRRFSRLRHG